MTYDELLAKIELQGSHLQAKDNLYLDALRAVVKLHKPMWNNEYCGECHPDHNGSYPCSTIQAIEKELE